MPKQLLIGFVFLVIAILTWWGKTVFQSTEQEATVAASPDTPDHFMENFTTQVMDEQGKLVQQISAPFLTHYASSDRTDIKQPILHIYRNNSTWEIAAEQGQVLQHGDTIILTGNVDVRQSIGEQLQTQLKTQQLDIYPDKNYARTQTNVIIEKGKSRITAAGLYADLNTQQFELSKVKGIYDSP